MKKTGLILFVIGIVLFAAQSCMVHEKKLQEAGAKLLFQADLEKLFSIKQKVKFRSPNASGTMNYFPDGKMTINYGRGSDSGRYTLEKGQFCSKWNNLRNGRKKCFRIYQIDENKYDSVDLDGRYTATTYYN